MNTLNELREVVAQAKRENQQDLEEARRAQRVKGLTTHLDDENQDENKLNEHDYDSRDLMDMTLADVDQLESKKRPRSLVRRGNMADLASATYVKELQLMEADEDGYTRQVNSGKGSVEDQLRALEAQPLSQAVEEMAKLVADADSKRKSKKTTGYTKNDRFNEKLDKMLG